MHRPPFRADHIGSLLRPPALRQAYRAFNDRALDEAGFVAARDAATRDAIALQADAGLAVVTDGEFRRASYWSRFVERTEGLSVSESRFTLRDEQGQELSFTAPLVTGKVARQRSIALDEYCFLRDNAKALPKVTLPAPSTMHFWRGTGYAVPGVYDGPEKFFRDLAAVYRAEIAALAAAGCLYVDALGDAIASAPPAMAVGVHMCRGNFKGKYLAEGGYDAIAKALFGVTGATHFLLEFDTARAGDFAPLRFVAPDKGVVLGLVSSKSATLETVEDLLKRIDEAARFIDKDRLAISPQCGFASTVAGNPLSEADGGAKLGVFVPTAPAAWG